MPQYEDDMWDLSALKKGVEADLRALDNPEPSEPVDLETLLSDDVRASVDELKAQLSDSRYWAMLILPNGAIETIASENKDKGFTNKLEFLRVAEANTGGFLLTSGV